MQRGDKLIIVRNVDATIIAALTALGITLDADCPYQETRELIDGRETRVVTWVLRPASACGRYDTQEMLKAWADLAFARNNPEHPFAYIKQAFDNLKQIEQTTNAQSPLALIRKGKRIALIPFDAAPERREELLKELDT